MQKNLFKYYKALKALNPTDAFWIFDNQWQLTYTNAKNYQSEKFKIYSSYSKNLLSVLELQQIIQSNNELDIYTKNVEIIAFYEEKSKYKAILLASMPIYHNQQIIGFIITEHGNLGNYEHANLINFILFEGKKQNPTIKLQGKRILEIAFFILRGYNYQEIASILSQIYNKNISPSTIGNLVRNILYSKFNVCNRITLKKALLNSNICTIFPQSLLNKGINNLSNRNK